MKYHIKHSLYKTLLLGMFCIAAIAPSAVANAKKAPVLSQKKLTLQVGKKKQLKVKYTKSKVKWKSSKIKIATVTSKGKVTARKKGSAIITAKVAGKTLRCAVIVKPKTAATTPDTPATTEAVIQPTTSLTTETTQPDNSNTTETLQPDNPNATEEKTTEESTTENTKIPDIMDPDTKDKGWSEFY